MTGLLPRRSKHLRGFFRLPLNSFKPTTTLRAYSWTSSNHTGCISKASARNGIQTPPAPVPNPLQIPPGIRRLSTPTSKTRTWTPITNEGSYRLSKSGPALKITLTRPQNGNALTNPMIEGITTLFQNLANDKSIFHIVLESEGKFFCTGMDLSSSASSASDDPDEKARYYRKVSDLFKAIEDAPQTTIAAIEGSCFGGGVGLAFVCDIRLVSEATKFRLTEVTLGLTPAVISRFLVREWGPAFAREAMLTGREVSGQELKRIGAVHSVSKDVQGEVDNYLDQLANCAPKAGAKVKELVQMGYEKAGSQELDDSIKSTFERMLEPGSEGEFGMAQFRKKIKGNLDWEGFWKQKTK